MSHGITKIDVGVVGQCGILGGPWHGLPQYETFDGPVPYDVTVEKVGYSVVKSPVFTPYVNENGIMRPLTVPEINSGKFDGQVEYLHQDGMHVLSRTDAGSRVSDVSVGNQYTVYSNTAFMEAIKTGLLDKYPEKVSILSAGTLFGGSKTFICILMDCWEIEGDNGKIANKMMLVNQYGGATYLGMVMTRPVCNNTVRAATAEMRANESFKKFVHTKSIAGKVEEHMFDLSHVFTALDEQKVELQAMAKTPMNSGEVDLFIDALIPLPKAAEIEEDERTSGQKRSVSMATTKRDTVLDIFENKDDLQGGIARTRYAMYQAVADFACNKMITRGSDDAYVYMDAIGNTASSARANLTDKAFDLLRPEQVLNVA